MDEKLAAELVEMAESQFAAQAPLAELMEEDPAFAAWVQRVQMPITGKVGGRGASGRAR